MANPIAEKRSALLAQCPMPATRSDAEAARQPIHVDWVGDAGPRVVVIHGGVQGGIGGGPATFAKQRVLSERGFHVGFAERPGFGRSPTRGVDDMERDALWIANLLGDGAHLIGHSFGGAEALLAAARRPGSVRSLILIEPALQALIAANAASDPKARIALEAMGKPMVQAETPADFALAFMRDLGTGDETTRRQLDEYDNTTANAFGCALLQARMAPPPALEVAMAAVRKAAIPVLLISGGWSPAFDYIAHKAADLMNGKVTIVPSPNHYAQLENPEFFNRIVGDFMRAHDTQHHV